MLKKLRLRLRALFFKSRMENELDEEVKFHLEKEIEQNLTRGMSPEEARLAALRSFGGVERVKEESRDVRGVRLLEELWQDLRYGVRMLVKQPGFTLIAVITLALGIGANTAIFSVVNAALLRPLPYHDPDRLAMLWTDNPKQNLHEVGTGYPIYQEWKKKSRVFEDLAVCSRNHPVTLASADEMERIESAVVSANFFPLLGVPPALGRGISTDDQERGQRVVVLSHQLWQRRFGSAPDAIGKTLEIDGQSSHVIGVMPASFQFPTKDVQLWEPITSMKSWESNRTNPNSHWWRVVGRLKPEVTLTQAQTEMSAIGRQLEQVYPTVDFAKNSAVSFGVNVVPLNLQIVGRNMRLALWVLFGAVVCVLLIACANVANLLLARGAAREREFAIRLAIGAGRTRLIRQLLTESILLSFLSSLLGVLVAAVAMRALVATGPPNLSRLDEIGIDPAALAFTLGIALLTGILFGLAPALKLSLQHPNAASLKEGSRGAAGGRVEKRTRRLLVIAEFALAVMLLAGAGLLIRSFLRVQAIEPGFRPERVLTMKLEFPRSKSDAQAAAFYQQAVERVEALPGVLAAGLINDFLIEQNPDDVITVEGHAPVTGEQLWDDTISPGYFRAMNVPLLRGRCFSAQDGREAMKVAIINETMARRFFAGEDPLGKRFKFGEAQSEEPWRTVVGVVADMRRQGLERPVISQIFVPHLQSPGPGMLRNMNLMARTATDPLQLAAAVRNEVHSIDKTVPLFGVTTLERQLDALIAQRRFQTLLLSAFSALALILAGIGIYGLMRYAVTQRTHEIGIRLALGAQARDVLGLVIREGLVLAFIGIGAGIVGALWLTDAMSSLLYGVSATDPVTFALGALLLVVIAMIASYIPARRATRVDPLVALRCE